MLIVFTTTSEKEHAHDLAEKIVTKRLAACVQILPKMTSVYSWESVVRTDAEHLLLIKTFEEHFDELSEFIRKNHIYEVPEIVALKAERTSDDYLAWMKTCLGR